jgi:protein SCO1/2
MGAGATEEADAMAAVKIGLSGTTRQRGCRARLSLLASAALLIGGPAALLGACAPPHAASAAQAQQGGPGGPFSLVDQDGRPVDQSVLKGKWSIVFFGYTFCPDFCPTTLTTLGKAMDELGPKANDAQVIFITVDPQRDTPAALKTYISSRVFPKHIMGLTGTPAQVAQAAKAYVVYYQKEGSGPNYTMDHSTALYLMDPNGRFHGVIADGLTPKEDARQIAEAMRGA